MPDPLRILLAGVPFGCDNVGDEAILECAVNLFREAAPGCEITVATNDGPATAAKLGVAHAPLIGFEEGENFVHAKAVISGCDVFVWCGATGLSDYPEIPCALLDIAHGLGKTTVLWGVGMNDELNPAKYTVLPGKRRALLKTLTALTLGSKDFIRAEEQRRARRARTHIARSVGAASLVVVRDPEARDELLRSGVAREIVVGADSALVLRSTPWNSLTLPPSVAQLLATPGKKVGVCISAQRRVANTQGLLDYLDRLTGEDGVRVLFVPMNPITDAALMKDLHGQMRCPERAAVLEGRYEPGDVLAVTSRLDVVVASRLHLLILASIAHAPIIGISRGSKLDNFLRPFGLKTAGSVESLDPDALFAETRRLLEEREAFERTSRRVREDLTARLEQAMKALCDVVRTGSTRR